MSERLQLDLLVGRQVYDSEGRKLGRVDEAQMVREDDHYVVEGLLMGANSLTERLGVDHIFRKLPNPLGFHPWNIEAHIVYWDQIDSIEEKSIKLKARREEIQSVQPE